MSGLPAPRPTSLPLPWSVEDLREEMLRLAGLPKEHLAEMLRDAILRAHSLLGAKRAKVIAHQGEVKAVLEFADNEAQLRAAEFLADLTGAMPPKRTAPTVRTVLQIKWPSWGALPPTVEHRPVSGEMESQIQSHETGPTET